LKIIEEQEKERELKNKQKHKGKKSPSEDIPKNASKTTTFVRFGLQCNSAFVVGYIGRG